MKPHAKHFATIILAIAASVAAYATDTRTAIFDNNFRSLRACTESNYYAPPVVELDGDDRVRIEFDEISPEMRYMRYSLLHCDANWQPSQLVESDYVDGFNEADIEEYDFSSGTFANYVHYGISLPNEDMPILLSGNYLLRVYPEEDSENTLLQVRFSIVEKAVDIFAEVTSRTDIDYNKSHQQVTVTVDTKDYRVENMYADLKVVVTQNARSDNEAIVTNPLRVSSNKAFFEHDRKLIFPAGNEFRRFEMTTTNYIGMGIDRYAYHDPFYHAELKIDEPRCYGSYTYDQTQYGRFTIRESNAFDSNTGADYMIVHFALDIPRQSGGDIFVDGEFTQHNFTNANRMHFNEATNRYELDMPLKQGAYNYQYLWLPHGSKAALTAPIEGDFYQTVNEYQIKVYNRRLGERYDRLIGYTVLYSGQ
ncbi:MAG TPA: DUF5103 domain-containing protein [Candidatus Limisoma intestinavium]|uniref:DUF5103 domain-containing protein n=1 Tax=Candidatus Limisoma intestinavium TaxID=2840856 RepID=A0A9D1IKC5_9BACT|nr:DUF5103 domain-containing protein [Candidatus Limisoma intestinavium]